MCLSAGAARSMCCTRTHEGQIRWTAMGAGGCRARSRGGVPATAWAAGSGRRNTGAWRARPDLVDGISASSVRFLSRLLCLWPRAGPSSRIAQARRFRYKSQYTVSQAWYQERHTGTRHSVPPRSGDQTSPLARLLGRPDLLCKAQRSTRRRGKTAEMPAAIRHGPPRPCHPPSARRRPRSPPTRSC